MRLNSFCMLAFSTLLLPACVADLDGDDDLALDRLDQAATVSSGGAIVLSPPASGTTRWGKVAGGIGWDTGYAAVADGSGWVVTGTFQGTANFGCGTMTARGNSDLFLVRYSSSGACSWARQVGGAGDSVAVGIARGEGGSLLVTGSFSGTMDFSSGALTSAGPLDGFVARFSSTGAAQWARAFTGGEVYPGGIAADSQGNFVVAGSFAGTTNFGGADLEGPGDGDMFVARYTAAGVHSWSQRFGGAGYDLASEVAIDSRGQILVIGSFEGQARFGGAELTSAGGYDIALARFSATGAPLSSARFGSTGDDSGGAVAVDGSGGFAIAGYFQGSLPLGAVTLTSSAAYAGFVARFASSGAVTWARAAGNAGASVFAEGLGFDWFGNLYATGSMSGTATFGLTTVTGSGGSSIFAVKYSSLGAARWARAFGGAGLAGGLAIVPTTLSGVLVTGYSGQRINLGLGTLTGAGGFDVALAALAQ